MLKKISKIPFKGTPEQEAQLNAIIEENKHDSSMLMHVMQQARAIYGYLPFEVQVMIAEGMDVPSDDIDFIASFYQHAFFGVISEWFRTGMREEPAKFASQLWLIADGMRLALRKSAKRHSELS